MLVQSFAGKHGQIYALTGIVLATREIEFCPSSRTTSRKGLFKCAGRVEEEEDAGGPLGVTVQNDFSIQHTRT